MSLSKPHRDLLDQAQRLFSDKRSWDSFLQEVALHFYPEMAEFTTTRDRGTEFSRHLTTSFPLLVRRSLGDALGALLRPQNLDNTTPGIWFNISIQNEQKLDIEGKRWLEWATGVQRRAMYVKESNFVRSMKEGDHMFAAFGNAPLSVELNAAGSAPLYRAFHLKDVAWTENQEGFLNMICRRWQPTLIQMIEAFGSKAASQVRDKAKDNPFGRVNAMNIVIERERFESQGTGGKKLKTPWISIWIDIDNSHLLEEVGSQSRKYFVPRWVTVPGSQYASSPAVTVGLPDARLLQAMSLTLLETAEKFADPPVIATSEAIRTDVQLYAGGLTWVDGEYDEKLGSALRPLFQPQAGQGAALGLEMNRGVQDQLQRAFFLDTLSLPPAGDGGMSPLEVGERISEWIRRAMPIFEPMEFEYNAQIVEETFGLLMRNGAFGAFKDIPQSIRGADIRFRFESPIHKSAERQKGQKFLEAKAALLEAAELDPSTAQMLDAKETLRDVLAGIGVPSKWQRSDAEMQKLAAEAEQQKQQEQLLAQAGQAAGAAKDLAGAAKDFSIARDASGQITGGTLGA